jgi:hypothetical protein
MNTIEDLYTDDSRDEEAQCDEGGGHKREDDRRTAIAVRQTFNHWSRAGDAAV